MRWFRLYSSVVHDPKVQRLHPAHFKHWINILCLASDNKDRGIVPDTIDIAFALRMKPVEASAILKKLEDEGLLDRTEDGRLTPHNWTERQRVTDDVATRVRRHREKKDNGRNELDKNVTLQKRSVDTDTDTDKNKDKNLPSSGDEVGEDWISKKKRKLEGKRLESFKLFWEAFDYKKGRAEAIDAWLDIYSLTNSLVLKIVEAAKVEAKGRPGLIQEGRTPKMAQGWLTARRWEDEQVNPVQTVIPAMAVDPKEAEQLQRVKAAYGN